MISSSPELNGLLWRIWIPKLRGEVGWQRYNSTRSMFVRVVHLYLHSGWTCFCVQAPSPGNWVLEEKLRQSKRHGHQERQFQYRDITTLNKENHTGQENNPCGNCEIMWFRTANSLNALSFLNPLVLLLLLCWSRMCMHTKYVYLCTYLYVYIYYIYTYVDIYTWECFTLYFRLSFKGLKKHGPFPCFSPFPCLEHTTPEEVLLDRKTTSSNSKVK